MDARKGTWMAAVGALVVAAIAAAPALATAGDVRPLQARGARLLEEGARRSAAMRELVDEIGRSDVVVYVDLDANEPGSLEGSLQFRAATPDIRYVRVWLQPRRTDEVLMPVLAHELQHAAEVARAAEVRSAESFRAMYAAVGKSANPGHYETEAAQRVGARVRRELEANR
jgi:hypothetical protein